MAPDRGFLEEIYLPGTLPQVLLMDKNAFATRNETIVKTSVDICMGIESFHGFLVGAKWISSIHIITIQR